MESLVVPAEAHLEGAPLLPQLPELEIGPGDVVGGEPEAPLGVPPPAALALEMALDLRDHPDKKPLSCSLSRLFDATV